MANFRDKKAALKFAKEAMRGHGQPEVIVTDKLRSYGAALKELGADDRQQTGRWMNNRAETRRAPTTDTRTGAWVRSLLERKPTRLVTVAIANKTARTAWVLLAKGESYRAAPAN